jgi:hypothetical protein
MLEKSNASIEMAIEMLEVKVMEAGVKVAEG